MPHIHVTGPVIRQSATWDLYPWVQEVYKKIESVASPASKVTLPHADPQLERDKPKEFFHDLNKRISSSKAVITVFTPGNVAAAIETSMASVAGKRILIIAEDPDDVPRLLVGLPGVVEAISPETFTKESMEYLLTNERE